jgi:hypothetical protein
VIPEPAPIVETDRLLRLAAAEVRRQWQEALDRADFREVERWVNTGQAVHRALVALDG